MYMYDIYPKFKFAMSTVTHTRLLISLLLLLLCMNSAAKNVSFNSNSTVPSLIDYDSITTGHRDNYLNMTDPNKLNRDYNSYYRFEEKRRVIFERHRRASLTRKEKIEAKFREYYDCINKKNEDVLDPKTTADIYTEGSEVELSCKLCLRPDQDVETYNIRWRRYQRWLSTESYITESTGRFVIDGDKNLIIKKIDIKDVGLYTCIKDKVREAIYLIDVSLEPPKRKTINWYHGKIQLLKDEVISSLNLRVFTEWGHWGQCDKCDTKGAIHRILGTCKIRKADESKPVSGGEIWTLDHYENGAPCRSPLLPGWIQSIPQIHDRPDEAQVRLCYQKCPKAVEIMSVTDSTGDIVANMEIRFYDFGDDLKNLPKPPKRDAVHKYAGQKLMLKCPVGSEVKAEETIRWQNGSSILDPLRVRQKTKGRVYIDHTGRLFIRRLRVADTAPFNCWIVDRHIATIKVIVTKKLNKNIKTYISLAGFVITIGSIVAIALSVCFKKRPRTAR